MKKNKMLRIASVLLVAVMMSTCAISGTFAKYVTDGTGTDSARVAKFGVTVTADSDIFDVEYAKEDENYTLGTVSVKASENVIAPGTTKTMANVSLSGQPEVAVRVSNSATFSVGDNWMVDDEFYCPIVITVLDAAGATHTICGLDYNKTQIAEFEDDVVAAISTATKDYVPTTNLTNDSTKAVSVTWTWAFDDAAHTHCDGKQDNVKDTALGDAAAAAVIEADEITLDITVTTTVTQIN